MEMEERKRVENIITGFRWIVLLFIFFLVPMNLNVYNIESDVIISELFSFLIYDAIYIFTIYFCIRFTKNDKRLDAIIGISNVFDMIAVAWGANIVLKVCQLPVECIFLVYQTIIFIRYRSTFFSVIGNLIIFLYIWTFEFVFGSIYYPDMWEVRGIFWTIALIFNISIFWSILKYYDKLYEQKEIENYYLENSKQSINNLIQINKISAALNGSLSQNEIIKILLKNISPMVNSDDCAVLLYSKAETEGYLYKYSDFKDTADEDDPIGYMTICIGDEIKKVKYMKDYKHVVGAYQPFDMIDLVNIYNMESIVLNPEKRWLYMFKVMCSMKEAGFLLIATDNQFPSEVGQFISLLVGQTGTALTTAVLYNSVKMKANTDPLTGAKTRRYLRHFLDKEIERSKRHHRRFCVLFFDIDNFKTFNDVYGHKVGDDVLKIIYEVTKATVRKMDLVARYGGEEFVVVLPETEFDQGCCTAERIRQNIEAYPLKEKYNVDRRITVSIGLSEYDTDGETEEELINRADWGMYEAKSNGKNQVCSFRQYKTEYEKSVHESNNQACI